MNIASKKPRFAVSSALRVLEAYEANPEMEVQEMAKAQSYRALLRKGKA